MPDLRSGAALRSVVLASAARQSRIPSSSPAPGRVGCAGRSPGSRGCRGAPLRWEAEATKGRGLLPRGLAGPPDLDRDREEGAAGARGTEPGDWNWTPSLFPHSLCAVSSRLRRLTPARCGSSERLSGSSRNDPGRRPSGLNPLSWPIGPVACSLPRRGNLCDDPGLATGCSEATGPSPCAGNTPRGGGRNFPGRLLSPAGCKCISELRSPRIRCHSELGRGKIPDPALPLLASGAGYSSPSYRLQAAGGLPAEPGRSCCAQLEDSAGREARSALAAREAETAGCWLRPRLPELAHQRSGAWCAFSSLAEWISGDTCYLPWFLAAWVEPLAHCLPFSKDTDSRGSENPYGLLEASGLFS